MPSYRVYELKLHVLHQFVRIYDCFHRSVYCSALAVNVSGDFKLMYMFPISIHFCDFPSWTSMPPSEEFDIIRH